MLFLVVIHRKAPLRPFVFRLLDDKAPSLSVDRPYRLVLAVVTHNVSTSPRRPFSILADKVEVC